MSKGSPMICLRLPPSEYERLLAELAKRNQHYAAVEFSVQEFVRVLIDEGLAKRKRSRVSHYKQKAK